MSDDSREDRGKPLRGFAALIAAGRGEEVKAYARAGGIAAHQQGTAHEFTSEEAREAGRKGGAATHAKRRSDIEKDLPASPDEA